MKLIYIKHMENLEEKINSAFLKFYEENKSSIGEAEEVYVKETGNFSSGWEGFCIGPYVETEVGPLRSFCKIFYIDFEEDDSQDLEISFEEEKEVHIASIEILFSKPGLTPLFNSELTLGVYYTYDSEDPKFQGKESGEISYIMVEQYLLDEIRKRFTGDFIRGLYREIFSEDESFEFEIGDTDCINAPFSELSPELMFNL